MLSINKTYCWLFAIALLIQIPGVNLFKFADEILVGLMMILVFLDVVINKQYMKYKFLWIIAGVIGLFAIYSIFFRSYNIPIAVVHDYITQMKPFCYFCISYAIVPKLTGRAKQILKGICIMNAIIGLFSIITGTTEDIFFHVTYLGLVSLLSFMIYLFCSVDDDGKVSRKDLIISVIILTIGLGCTRSKFYGEYVMALYLLFVYVPGFSKNIKFTHIVTFFAAIALVFIVAWSKIDFYFVSGGADVVMDEETMQTVARPMLYAGMVILLGLHPIFGSGLASFATNASSSAVNYSEAYRVTGLDEVWGLSPSYDAFICDAFYPSLAQFGIIGIILFVYFFVWIYKKISLSLYTQGKIPYVVGLMAIIVILIESIAATTFNQPAGAMCMMILGGIASTYKNKTKEEIKVIRSQEYINKEAKDYIKK